MLKHQGCSNDARGSSLYQPYSSTAPLRQSQLPVCYTNHASTPFTLDHLKRRSSIRCRATSRSSLVTPCSGAQVDLSND
ncbi:hypothetical protein MRB53_037426 [Persea americana]|nr:hypothetical protein MRB53_037426 [Persea americana]